MVYPFGKVLLPPVYKLWLRKVEGLENVPRDRPFIIAANHSSYYDTLLLHTILIPILDKKIHALVNSNYWNNPLTKTFLDWGECIPVFVKHQPGAKIKNKKSFLKAVKLLREKEILLIFPEGRRSPDGKLGKAYSGIAKIALEKNTPVLPAGIIGANEVLPRGKLFPRFRKCDVKIGKLMVFDRYKKTDEKTLEEITRKIMKEIAKLIGQKYNY